MKKEIIILIIIGIFAGAFSGCVGEKTSEPIAHPPQPKYTARIYSIVDITSKQPEMITRTPGFYEGVSTNSRKISRFVDSNLGEKGTISVILVADPETKIGINTYTPQNMNYYGIVGADEQYLKNAATSASDMSSDMWYPSRVYYIQIVYDTPYQEDLKYEESFLNNMGLHRIRTLDLHIYTRNEAGDFDLIITEPNQLNEGFS